MFYRQNRASLSSSPCLSHVTTKALDTSLPNPSPSSSSIAPALPCRTVTSPVAAAACPISTSRGFGSWQTPALFSLSHDSISEKDFGAPSLLSVDHCGSTLEVFVGCSRTLSVVVSAGLIVAQFMGMNFSQIAPSTPSISFLLPIFGCYLWHICWSLFTLIAAPKSSPSKSARSYKARNTTLAAASLSIADTSAESPRTSAAPSTLLHAPSAIGVPLHLPVFYFADVLCYLCSDGNLELSDAALELPVFVPLSNCAGLVHYI
ncbi:hypothetical protein BHE74_00046058 [Ensete ventricosum]|nr:hypothetical protein BHE74_00046058 [Ensete ventricosum]